MTLVENLHRDYWFSVFVREKDAQNWKCADNSCNAPPLKTLFILYNLHRNECHLYVVFVIYWFFFKKESTFLLQYLYFKNVQLYQRHLWLTFLHNLIILYLVCIILYFVILHQVCIRKSLFNLQFWIKVSSTYVYFR